jgi:Protein of unknown function (DUF3489)
LRLLIARNRGTNVIDHRIRTGDALRKDIMPAFTIDAENNITVFPSLTEIEASGAETETFTNLEELTALANKWPGARLVEIWNTLPGVEPIERFTSRSVAVTRIWKVIQHLRPAVGRHGRRARSGNGRAKNNASRKRRNVARENTKTAKVIALIRQPKGASLRAIMRATAWQAHTVRGFISGQLGKKMGLRVRSFQRDGERVYALKG